MSGQVSRHAFLYAEVCRLTRGTGRAICQPEKCQVDAQCNGGEMETNGRKIMILMIMMIMMVVLAAAASTTKYLLYAKFCKATSQTLCS